MWVEEYEKALRVYFWEDMEDSPVDSDTPLAALGIGSVEIVSLIADLEDIFGTALPDSMLTPATFATPGTLWAALDETLGLTGNGHQ